jgi:hypothetical protein
MCGGKWSAGSFPARELVGSAAGTDKVEENQCQRSNRGFHSIGYQSENQVAAQGCGRLSWNDSVKRGLSTASFRLRAEG